MITLQLPPPAAKSAPAVPPGQMNPASPIADAAGGAAEPLLFSFLLAQQALLGAAAGAARGTAQEEAATDKKETPTDAAVVTPWIWLPVPPARDAAATAAKPGDDKAVLTDVPGAVPAEVRSATLAASSGAARVVRDEFAGLQAATDSRTQAQAQALALSGDAGQPAVHAQPESQVVQVQRPVAAAEKLNIPSEVGTPRWTRDIHQNISLLVQSRTSVAELRLTPADMGPIQIRIDFSSSQPNVSISVQQADTRNALDAALPRLRDMLAESGVTLGGASVEQGSGGAADPGRDPARFSGHSDGHSDGQSAGRPPNNASPDDPLSGARVIALDQLVDTYA